jgi:iron complex transport system substrate-binding protein
MYRASRHRAIPRFGVVAFLLALATGGAAACAGGTTAAPPSPRAGAYPLTLTDDEGVTVTLPSQPRRIVTFAPATTEIVFALGLGSRLVGVSYHALDDYPPAASRIPEVGGASTSPNIERVIALHPDVLLATAGGSEWKARLRQLGVPVFSSNATSFEDALHDIGTIGKLLGVPEEAVRLTARMDADARSVQAGASGAPPVACFLDLGGLYTVGPNDFPFDLLRRAGCDPVTASAKSSYPMWSKDALVREDPAVYLFTSDSGDSVKTVARAFPSLAATREGRIYSIDSDLISRPGPRLVQGLAALAAALHP